MKTRRLHRALGIILLLPFFGWAVTGLVFFIKPGYSDAYQVLQPKTYVLTETPAVVPRPDWLEYRYLRTVLGDHLLVRTPVGWQHLTASGERRAMPSDDELRRLLQDAFSVHPKRYGNIISVAGDTVTTDTGVNVSVDWNRLALRQRGQDTRLIDNLYRVHYLQWTGIGSVDRVLGIAGLLLLMLTSALGAKLALGNDNRTQGP